MNQVFKTVMYDDSGSGGTREERSPEACDTGSHLQVSRMRVRDARTSGNTLLYTEVSAMRGSDVRKADVIHRDNTGPGA
jgi:hypothetical protein